MDFYTGEFAMKCTEVDIGISEPLSAHSLKGNRCGMLCALGSNQPGIYSMGDAEGTLQKCKENN